MDLNVAATLGCERYFGLDVFQIVDAFAMLNGQLQHNVTSRRYRSARIVAKIEIVRPLVMQ